MKNPIALSIPFFFLAMVLELVVARAKRRSVYRFTDAVTDLGCGISSQLVPVFLHTALLAGYVWVYEHRFFDLAAGSVATWVLAFVVVDFIYYWWHRWSHEVNVLWAAHVVHHTSEDYNLAVALRQAVTTHFTVIPFYLPLAAAGVPPVVYATVHALNTVLQFWIHTELIGKLGPIEVVMNTPSHHRVHHAINPQYLDKNYAGVFIVWDRWFGTFEEERERPVYGTVKPLASYNPFWAQFHYCFHMVAEAVRAPKWADKLRVLWASPAWRPEGLPPWPATTGVTPESRAKFDPRPTRAAQIWIGVQFAIANLIAFFVIYFQAQWSTARLAAGAVAVVLVLFSADAFFERRKWAVPFEVGRLAVTAAAVVLAFR